jgi:exopolysaccharide biosynthesis polyprenyl glycosylphosphotransferase
VPTEAPPTPPEVGPPAPVPLEPSPELAGDVRRSQVYLLSRGPWTTLVRRSLGIVTLAILDIAGLAIGVYAALVIRSALFEDTVFWSLLWDGGPREWLPFLAPITVLVFFQVGLYAPRELRAGPGKVLSGLVIVALTILAFGLGTGYEFTTTGLIPTAVVTSAIAIGVLRAAYASASLEVLKVVGVRRRILLLGEGDRLSNLQAQLLAARGGIGIEIVGAVARVDVPGLRMLGHELTDLPALFEHERPDELVLAEADFDERNVLEVVHLAHRFGVKVKLAPSTTELLVHEGEYVPGQGVPLFELRPPILSGFAWAGKRAFDLVVAAAILVLGMPVWLVVAAAVKLDSRGSVLYRDRRVGVGEEEFGMLKFRTMAADAASQQDELEELNEASGALFKIRDDPRVTRVGALLRRFSLDELPQLVNVLRGEMSLVGPRPLPLRDHALLEDWHKARYHVLPGMTGLWQISGRSGLEFDDLVRLDFTYIENWSIWSDISIIAKTIPAVIAQRGAY